MSKAAAKSVIVGFWAIVATLTVAVLLMTFVWTPVESTMGPIQKIFYLHLPVAINTFLALLINFIASVGFLWQRHRAWDDLAQASAKIGVLLCSIVLLTGMIWAHSAWGNWWVWSPRLTLSLVLWLLYVVYLMIRPSIETPQRRALVSAVYGTVAFLDVPLVYFSVKLMPDIHPTNIVLEPRMKLTLAAWFVPVTLTVIGLIIARYKLARRRTQTELANHDSRINAVSIGGAT